MALKHKTMSSAKSKCVLIYVKLKVRRELTADTPFLTAAADKFENTYAKQ